MPPLVEMSLACASCKRTDLVEADFSVLSLHILKLKPASISQIHCARCIAAARASAESEARAAMTVTANDDADKAFNLGEAILDTSTIAPSDAGSDDDLEQELEAAGLDGVEGFVDLECDVSVGEAPPAKVDGKAARALTTAALAEHEQRTEVVERRQFNW